MRRAAHATGVLALAGSAVALALAAGHPAAGDTDVALLAKKRSGSLKVKNSLGGEPIVRATSLVPGDAVEGEVTIKNASRGRVRISLVPQMLSDSPGLYGGALSSLLRAEVTEYQKKKKKKKKATEKMKTVYEGTVGSIGELELGRWKARAKRRYEFRIEFPEGGIPASPSSGDNAYQGSSADVSFVWQGRP